MLHINTVGHSYLGQHNLENRAEMNKKIKILLAFVVFIILFIMYTFNSNNNKLAFFKSNKELFIDKFLSIEMNRNKYLGEVADSSNHMNAYMNFGQVYLPMLDQWNGKIKEGDYVSKKKGSTTLIIERNKESYDLYFDIKNFDGAPLPIKRFDGADWQSMP
ncbi:hypothetical protein [Frigoriflavimonas asaccharolytica]|uniref:hypothetical protein n=1 Tax=Frigoriflavimonas asaccharolytica TaxID=2735899 RepID=UPI0036D377B1